VIYRFRLPAAPLSCSLAPEGTCITYLTGSYATIGMIANTAQRGLPTCSLLNEVYGQQLFRRVCLTSSARMIAAYNTPVIPCMLCLVVLNVLCSAVPVLSYVTACCRF